MHCLVRDCRLESDTGGQKNGQIYKNRNSTASLGITDESLETYEICLHDILSGISDRCCAWYYHCTSH
ncbi:hypothetical protein D1819_18410 [Pseudoalteromonas tunicata]|nr:hypothetical protein D1819_18410 [Pseudoalteromonas tunicata]